MAFVALQKDFGSSDFCYVIFFILLFYVILFSISTAKILPTNKNSNIILTRMQNQWGKAVVIMLSEIKKKEVERTEEARF